MAKVNIVKRNGSSAPECTNCNHRFNIKTYPEMVAIVDNCKFCPECGARWDGCQVDGVDFEKCTPHIQWWASGYKEKYKPSGWIYD